MSRDRELERLAAEVARGRAKLVAMQERLSQARVILDEVRRALGRDVTPAPTQAERTPETEPVQGEAKVG